MSDFYFFTSLERQYFTTLLRAAKAGNTYARGKLLETHRLKVADKETLARINQERAQGRLSTELPWL